MLIPLSKRFFRDNTYDNGNSRILRQQRISSSSRNARKIKELYDVNLSSSSQDNKYNLSPSALPTHCNDSDHDHAPSNNEIDYVIFGLPSEIEIQNAFTSLQQVFPSELLTQRVGNTRYSNLDSEVNLENTSIVDHVSSNGSETDWKEPHLSSHNPNNLLANGYGNGYGNVAHAIHLLQTDEHVQTMVKSLSSDRSIWHAVVNNEVVRELSNTVTSERNRSTNGTISNDSPNMKKVMTDSPNMKNVMTLISDAIKAKLMEAIEKIMKIVNKLFASEQQSKVAKVADATKLNLFNRKLNISVMLSIMIFLIVVVGRIYQSNSFN